MRPRIRHALVLAALVAGAFPIPANAQQVFSSSAGRLVVETVARGLEHPWGLTFLSDGRMLVTERPGRIRIATRAGRLSPPLEGVPQVLTVKGGQAGLLDIATERDAHGRRIVYFCYAEPVDGGARTAVASAQLIDEGLPYIDRVKVLFRAQGPAGIMDNFGCRIALGPDGTLFASVGDYFHPRHEAQNLAAHLGKIIRIKRGDGSPAGHSFPSAMGALPGIWSYGHRNPQGLTIHPDTGKLWSHEHGPRGGDELNLIQPGRNYGWPVIGYGLSYAGGLRLHDSSHKEGMEQPVFHWTPAIAPSGMAFYRGHLFPKWRGNLFIGALAGQALIRLTLNNERVVNEERLLAELNERIRDVRAGPDGALWLLTDNEDGRILRVTPAR
jgi:glucose/arabinose dehydrogenase